MVPQQGLPSQATADAFAVFCDLYLPRAVAWADMLESVKTGSMLPRINLEIVFGSIEDEKQQNRW